MLVILLMLTNLNCLQIHSVVSSLRSTKFQVFVECFDYDGNEIFRKIGDVSLSDDQNGFCLTAGDASEQAEESFKVDSIYPYARKSIKSASTIKILIQDTKLRRAPVLKSIELWGLPSFRNPRSDIKTIHSLWNFKEPSARVPKCLESSSDDSDSSFVIPEEFLDSITHALLVMPYILPSGNIIDESTLEKHNKHEATYGRLPSDPFTSLPYTRDNQPKFNEVLKARLDLFKLQNSNELEVKKSGRTLGREVPASVASTSGYHGNGHVSKKIKLTSSSSSDLDSLISSIYKNNQVSIFTQPRETRLEQSRCCNCTASSSLDFYRISICSHTFCKPCLLQLNSSCGLCQTTFQSKDVKKLNL